MANYDGAHKRTRAYWAPLVRAGGVACWRCSRAIVAVPGVKGEGWQLGHRTHLGLPSAPEHQHCNQSAGGRTGNAIRWHGQSRRSTPQPSEPPPRPPVTRCTPCPQVAPNGQRICNWDSSPFRRSSPGVCW